MTDTKSQILSEVESELGPGYVMTVADAMEKCPTLSKMVELSEKSTIVLDTSWWSDKDIESLKQKLKDSTGCQFKILGVSDD